MAHVLEQTYFPKHWVLGWLSDLAKSKNIAGSDPKAFWKTANFLSIQQHGNSQQEMLEEFGKILNNQFGMEYEECGSLGGPFVYIDDAIFSGGRARDDLSQWIEQAHSKQLDLHVIVIAVHTSAAWFLKKQLRETAEMSGKTLKIQIWRGIELENRKSHKNSSEVLWPTEIPDDDDLNVFMSENSRFPFDARIPSEKFANKIFSSESGRHLLEQEFLSAGMRIRSFSENTSPAMRPLGFGSFNIGFGSMIVTYRNCPNNCPLALWWGGSSAARLASVQQVVPVVSQKNLQ